MKRKARGEVPSHVVGVGGSAGSLEPLERFFGVFPADTTLAFVVVTHRDPRAKGMMVEILQRFTRLAVREATAGVALERGVVYVVPANKELGLADGRVVLSDRAAGARGHAPIDALFSALAFDRRERSVGVVLSGMGADGTAGLATIKENFGLALVQDPSSADYDAMPRAAIDAAVADVVDTPEKLARKLTDFASRVVDSTKADSLEIVLGILRSHTGNDFSQYKRSTLIRRIERRMALHRISAVPRYIGLLERDAEERQRLLSDLLISVTRFFRDPTVFETLGTKVIPELLRGRSPDRPLRLWVAGCATGEEAYSLAILVAECIQRMSPARAPTVQIYATDLDQKAIDFARRGSFGREVANDVTPERLARWFVAKDDGYRVRQELRDMIVFATQNVASDPPFTKIDLLSCRNLLIYLQTSLQRRLLGVFRYSLAPRGVLVLGPSEGVTTLEHSFVAPYGDQKIFQVMRPQGLAEELPPPATTTPSMRLRFVAPTGEGPRANDLGDLVRRFVLERIAPVVVVVDAQGELLFSSRRSGRYLEQPAGKPSANVVAMARHGLELPLRSLLRKVRTGSQTATQRAVKFRTQGREALVNLSAFALDAERTLFAFDDVAAPPPEKAGAKRKPGGSATELRTARASLAALTAEMTRSEEVFRELNEALQSANEELQSTNEELQSTNEELMTSKEEMQSMNEELLTLNGELQTSNEQLATTNDDMRNLLDSTQIPTLFLDNELLLKRYTAQATRIAPLIASDVGRPVTDIRWGLRYRHLAADVKEVLRTLVFKEAEVVANDGNVYAMRIHPYRTVDDVIDGVVMTFLDVTAYRTTRPTKRR